MGIIGEYVFQVIAKGGYSLCVRCGGKLGLELRAHVRNEAEFVVYRAFAVAIGHILVYEATAPQGCSHEEQGNSMSEKTLHKSKLSVATQNGITKVKTCAPVKIY